MQTSIATFSLIYMNAFIQRAEEEEKQSKVHMAHSQVNYSDRARLGKYLKRPQARKYKIHSKEKGTGNERECKRKDVGEENMFIL